MGFTTSWGANSSTTSNNTFGTLPEYNLPNFQKPSPLPNIAPPTYQQPGTLNLPQFQSPDLQEYIKNIDIPGVKIDVPEIDRQFIKEWTQEYGAPALAEERTGFREALMEARKYSDNPAVVAKVIRDIMRGRGTNISKILGQAGQTAAHQEASNRANILNAAVNNANLEQARNLTKVKAETEMTNKEIAEQNQRKYAEAQDAYQKVVQDMLNQRNAAAQFNNQAALSEWDRQIADAMAMRAAEMGYNQQKAFSEADKNFAAAMAKWEAEQKNSTTNNNNSGIDPEGPLYPWMRKYPNTY